MPPRARSRLKAAARIGHRSTAADRLARGGLLARSGFYLVLAYLVVRVAVLGDRGRQANTHGALALIAATAPGSVAICLAALGLFSFGIMRLTSGWLDREAGAWGRTTTLVQGVFYVGLTYVPVSFLLGHHGGTEQQQHANAGHLLGFPGGQALVVVAGLIVIGLSGWQIWTGLNGEFEDTMKLAGASPAMKRTVHIVGRLGIVARALVFMPLGGFLIVAALEYDPAHADGLDGELHALSHHSWGSAVIVIAALELVTFALYTLLEARYRDVTTGE